MSPVVVDPDPTPTGGTALTRRARLRSRLRALSRRTLLVNAVLIVLVIVAIVLAFLVIGNPSAPTTGVRTVAVTRGTVNATVSGSGNAVSSVSTPVDFATAGTVTTIDVKPGDTVALGQTLATIDPATANFALRSAEAQLANARAAFAQASSGPTAVKQQQDQLAVTQAQQGVSNANATLAAA